MTILHYNEYAMQHRNCPIMDESALIQQQQQIVHQHILVL